MKRPVLITALILIGTVAGGMSGMEYFLGIPIRPVLAFQLDSHIFVMDERMDKYLLREIQALERQITDLEITASEIRFNQQQIPNYILLKLGNLRSLVKELAEDRIVAMGVGG